tara:strand:- start:22019 stop:22360 length:342 start_codon:yes stop_codon:yes gene_type:complete
MEEPDMSVSEMKEKLESLDNDKWNMKSNVDKVNDTTRAIKYDNTPMDIYLKVESLAESLGIDVESEVDEIRSKVNDLESAIYELVAPFEDKLREIEYEYDDLESDIYEEAHCA